MGRSFRLELFDTDVAWTSLEAAPPTPEAPNTPPPEVEEIRLDAFENGYKAGWDDATKAQSSDTTRVSAELARNLEDMGFTLHEAREHVLRTLGPLMSEIVETLLPTLLRESIAPKILETVLPLAATSTESEMEIVTAPENRASIEALLQSDCPMPVRVAEEGTLAEGQAFVRLGAVEKEVDLSTIHDRVSAALRETFNLSKGIAANA